MKNALAKIATCYSVACRKLTVGAHRHMTALLLVLGVVLLTGGLIDLSIAQTHETGSFSEAAFNDTLIRNSVGNLFKLVEGAFGALIMVVAGLGAIVAAAMGAYRAALGMLVVAVGAFILRSLVSLFFGEDYTDFEAS